MNDASTPDTDPLELKVNPPKSETRDLIEFVTKLVVFFLALRVLVFAPFSIPSESMLPRLFVGDYLIVEKWPYGYSRHSIPFSLPLIPGPHRLFEHMPARGDVAVFKTPQDNTTDLIKRVIGLPGDMIQVRSGVLFINGTAVPKVRVGDFLEPVSPNSRCLDDNEEVASDGSHRCRYPQYRETLPGGKSYLVLDTSTQPQDNTQVYTVPEGHVFMMGDDRDHSADSRLEAGGFGYVPIEDFVGRATFTVFSTDGSANWLLPWTWFTAARGHRIGEGF